MDQSPGGDGGNLKKRAAARQLSKDDDLDAEEDDNPVGVSGTFQRASDAVLAGRRIVKVKRTASTATGPNPFAGISLVAPAAVAAPVPAPSSSAAAAAASTEPEVLEESALAPAGAEVAKGVAGEKDGGSESSVEGGVNEGMGASPSGDDGKEETVTEENGEAGEESAGAVTALAEEALVGSKQAGSGTNGEAASEKSKPKDAPFTGSGAQSFQLASSGTNAFGSFAGSFGSGFSSSSFNVANNSTSAGLSSFSFGSSTGFGAGSTGASAFPSLSTVFGKSNGSSPFQLFGSSANSTSSPAADGSSSFRTVALPEVPVETGEEKERPVFSSDATLFEFLKDGGWKERGKGELKVNISDESGRTARLVMRSKGNFRLLLNANLFPDMKLSRMENRGVSFACVNSVTERQDGLVTYAVKMRDSGLVADFMTAVESYRGRSQGSAQLKTPENSPKASEDHPKPFEGSSDADKQGPSAPE